MQASDLPNASFIFSQSSLQDYVDCPRRFQLRYLDQLHWPAVESAPVLENERRQIEGQMFHRMVQQYLIGLPAEKLTPLASTENLHRWWDNFLTRGPKLTGYDLFPELTLTAPTGKDRLTAKYDLVAVKPGAQALIFDWKTYHKRPEETWMAERLQTLVYPALLIKAGRHLNGGDLFQPEQVEMIYWYADFPDQVTKIKTSQVSYTRAWSKLEQLIKEIGARQSFPLTEDERRCAFCVYRSYCERGGKAGVGGEFETELSSEDIPFEQIQEIEF